jgi:phosphatidylglycerol---prolipoprotein diacylglyceryl transferase
MHPELFTLPGGFSVKTYGFFMMVGFLSGVWMAMRRATRVKADPDIVLDISLLCLIFGIGGARLFYVIHYWKSQFADAPNPLFAVIDITSGGLEFLGGFLGAVIATIIHAWWKKYSIRLYLDIMAPSAMWGLGIGRLGCYFNGCCFGVLAVSGNPNAPALAHSHDRAATVRERSEGIASIDETAAILSAGQDIESSARTLSVRNQNQSPRTTIPWAVQFPYGSPAHVRHWEQRYVTVPAELVSTSRELLQPFLVPEFQIFMPVEKRQALMLKVLELETAIKAAKDPEGAEVKNLRRELDSARKKANAELDSLVRAQNFPSRVNPQRQTSVSELERLARNSWSLPVHPAQIYATVGALLLSLLLGMVFYRRKRHGMVIGLVLLLYPIQRTLEEIIRADNPQDVAGLTVSQSISVALFLLGIAYLLVLYKAMPERSPYAVCIPQPEASAGG